jgi:hypothetical protein
LIGREIESPKIVEVPNIAVGVESPAPKEPQIPCFVLPADGGRAATRLV